MFANWCGSPSVLDGFDRDDMDEFVDIVALDVVVVVGSVVVEAVSSNGVDSGDNIEWSILLFSSTAS
jgi:hypothetical protein